MMITVSTFFNIIESKVSRTVLQVQVSVWRVLSPMSGEVQVEVYSQYMPKGMWEAV